MFENYVYVPAVRTSKFNLSAMKELYDGVREIIIPRLVIRGNIENVKSFSKEWSGRPTFIEISTFQMDNECSTCSELNDPTNYFEAQLQLLLSLQEINKEIIPVLNPPANTKPRDLVQLYFKFIKFFEKVAIRVSTNSANYSQSMQSFQTLLNVIDDDEFKKLILIVDAEKIESVSQVDFQAVDQLISIAQENEFSLIVLSSTSYPSKRPDSGTAALHDCIDPYWQYSYINKLKAKQIRIIYGDYSATDPTSERLEFDFNPKPIPFATYLLDNTLEWILIREGKGMEHIKFKDISNQIRNNPDYHGDSFCYANKTMEQIENGTRGPGNQGFWNKLKINQHISAMTYNNNNNVFDNIGLVNTEDDIDD